MALTIKVRPIGMVQVLDVAGRFVSGQPIGGLCDVIERLLGEGHRAFVVNLSGVSNIDTAGLGEVLAAYTLITRHGGRVAMHGPSGRTALLLQIAKLATVFDMFDDEPEALRALTEGPAMAGGRQG
jgi:anti-sigma B factor antagonist